MTLFGIVAAGVLGNIVGSWLAYAAGYYGRLELLEKNRLIHINPKHLATADRWFQRYGDITVFFTRMLPIIRTFISLPAGVAQDALLALHGADRARLHPVGADARDHRARGRRSMGGVARLPHYVDYAVLAGIVVLVVYLVVKRRRAKRDEAEGRPEPVPGTGPRRASPGSEGCRRAIWNELERDRGDLADQGRRAGAGPGTDGAAAGLQLGPSDPRSVARRMAMGSARPGAAQELRGRAARRRRGGAARRPAPRDRLRAARISTPVAPPCSRCPSLPPAIAGLRAGAPDRAPPRRAGCDRRGAASPARRRWSLADLGRQRHDRGEARAADGLALGLAQAAALVPGVSRNGATLAAARWRGFSRERSNLLSRTVALPVIVGATVLKGARLRRRGVDPGMRRAMAAGVAASFASTLASQRLIRLVERDRALWPYAAYRAARRRHRPRPAVAPGAASPAECGAIRSGAAPAPTAPSQDGVPATRATREGSRAR